MRFPSLLWIFGGIGAAVETLTATVNPVGALSTPGTATLSHSSNSFQPFTATVPVNYQSHSAALPQTEYA